MAAPGFGDACGARSDVGGGSAAWSQQELTRVQETRRLWLSHLGGRAEPAGGATWPLSRGRAGVGGKRGRCDFHVRATSGAVTRFCFPYGRVEPEDHTEGPAAGAVGWRPSCGLCAQASGLPAP